MASVVEQVSPAPAFRLARVDEVEVIRTLANKIWRTYYPGIITPAQIDYMLGRFYAADVLRREMTEGGVEYWLRETQGEPDGYASLGPTSRPDEIKLHKLYLSPTLHGRGLGSQFLQHLEGRARERGARTLILTVAKGNTKAQAAYRRNGFTVRQPIVIDIGGGFVMDDFLLEKKL